MTEPSDGENGEKNLSIEERLSFLEEQNEGLKRVGMMLVALVVLMGVTMIYQARTGSTALSSDGLILNNNGQPEAAITAFPNGHLGMMFYDHMGNLPKTNWNNVQYLDGLAIYDRKGNPRILLGLDKDENPVMVCVASDGRTLFTAVPPQGAPAQEGQPAGTQSDSAPDAGATPQPSATP